MASSCKIKAFYTSSEYSPELNLHVNQTVLGIFTKKGATALEFYNDLLNRLKGEKCGFKVDYNSNDSALNKLRYQTGLLELLQDLSTIINNHKLISRLSMNKGELLNLIADNLKNDLGAGTLYSISTDSITDINEDVEEKKDLGYKLFVQHVFGKCLGALRKMSHLFNLNLRRAAIFNMDTGEFVNTTRELNTNLINVKNELYSKITTFLSLKYPDCDTVAAIYDDEELLIPGYKRALKAMENHILTNIENGTLSINALYQNSFSSDLATPELDAIYAYTSLMYFDDFILDAINKFVSINTSYKNKEVPGTFLKYRFNRDSSSYRKDYRETESRTSIDNTSKYSKFIINTIPIISNGVDTGTTVGMVLFSSTFGKLFDNVYTLLSNSNLTKSTRKNSNRESLINALITFSENPSENAATITKILSTDKTVLKFVNLYVRMSQRDWDIISSVYNYIYAVDDDINNKCWDLLQHKSIRAMEYLRLRQSTNVNRYSIVDDISGVLNDLTPVTYLSTYYGANGQLSMNTRNTNKDRRVSERFKELVNTQTVILPLTQRKQLQTTMKLDRKRGQFKVNKVTLPNIRNPFIANGENEMYADVEFTVLSAATGYGTLDASVSAQFTPITGQDGDILSVINALFKGESWDENDQKNPSKMINLSSLNTRDRLLSADISHLLPHELLFVLVLLLIDERLNTRFLASEEGLKTLELYTRLRINLGKTKIIEELLLSAIKAQTISDVYSEYFDTTEDATLSHFQEYLKSKYKLTGIANVINDKFNSDRNKYLIRMNGGLQLRTMNPALLWADDLAEARMLVSGNEVLAISTNQLGTSDANYVNSFLGASLLGELHKQSHSAFPVSNLLFVDRPHLIRKMVINADSKNQKATKNVRTMKEAELFYDAFVHRFWHAFNTDGTYYVQPTTYSDKTKIIQYQVDGTEFNLDWKALRNPDDDSEWKNMTMSQRVDSAMLQFRELTVRQYASTVGQASQKILESTINKYRQIFDNENLTVKEINSLLKNLTLEELISRATSKGFSLMLYLDYQVKKVNGKSVLRLNPLLEYKAKFVNPAEAAKLFNKHKKNFIKDLVNSNSHFYVTYNEVITNKVNNIALEQLKRSSSPLAKVILSLYGEIGASQYLKEWVSGGQLIIAKSMLEGKEVNLVNTFNDNITKINPLLEIFYYTDTLLSTNLSISLTGFETNHPDKSKYNKVWDNVAKRYLINRGINTIMGPVVSTLNPIFSQSKIKELLKADIIGVSSEFMQSITDSDEIFNIDNYTGTDINDAISTALTLGKKIFTSNPALLAAYEGNKTIIEDESNIDINDVMALINDDLSLLSLSRYAVTREFTDDILELIENSAQNTQLKRNLIVGATMHKMGANNINGPAPNIQVAVIEDMPAEVFNFDGDRGAIESMDGSAFVTMELSILENKSLNSQLVGADTKPIWHLYNPETGTTSLVKFAAYEINNERMRLSLSSNAALFNLYKKMTNIRWNNMIDISVTSNINTRLQGARDLDFLSDILGENDLYYRSYDADGHVVYNKIINFGRDALGYYTEELVYGDEDNTIKVYHFFDADSNHHTITNPEFVPAGEHTIDSLFELWTALGGLYSCELSLDGTSFVDSDSSHYMVANFMNTIISPSQQNTLTTNSDNFVNLLLYEQPLKQTMIGYTINLTAMKKGATNINSVEKWFNNEPLSTTYLSTQWLGILLDAEHDVEEGDVITEPSLVISALESGGYLHSEVHAIYKTLGKIAEQEAQLEMDTIAKFIQEHNDSTKDYKKIKNRLYDIVGRSVLLQYNKSSDTNLTDTILLAIDKLFNINISHFKDSFKLPFSDPNIYSLVLPTIISNINQKSIKRKFAGVGSVQSPGYNVMLYFNINGEKYTFKDLVPIAISYLRDNNIQLPQTTDMVVFERNVVSLYLQSLLADPIYERLDVDDFVPTDIVDIITADGAVTTINLNSLDNYYHFKDGDWGFFGITNEIERFRINITSPKNLKPAIASFTRTDTGRKMCVFDLEPLRRAYRESNAVNRSEVQRAFENLHNGFFEETRSDGVVQRIAITGLTITPAEIVISNPYLGVLGVKNKSIALIKKEGPSAFLRIYLEPQSKDSYSAVFVKDNEDSVYISFESPRGNNANTYSPYAAASLYTEQDPKSEDERLNVWHLDRKGVKQFIVGRYISANDQYEYDTENRIFKDRKTQLPVNAREAKNLKIEDGTIYKYIEFVSRYQVYEQEGGYNNRHIKYYINRAALALAFNLNDDDSNKAHQNKINSFITNILDSIYASGNYTTVSVNPNMTRSSALGTLRFICHMKLVNPNFRNIVLNNISKAIQEQLNSWSDTQNIRQTRTFNFESIYNDYYLTDAVSKYNSWLQSLKFISVRIPALTLQSFMNTEAVAYTGGTTNTVYISHWMAWLQGTDYDIDKLYMMGLSFTNEGNLASWSNIFDYSSKEALDASIQLPFPRGLVIENRGTVQVNTTGAAYEFNIDGYINNISRIRVENLEDKAVRDGLVMTEVARLLNNLYLVIGDETNVLFRYSTKYNQDAVWLIDSYLKPHERTTVDMDGAKNYISLAINKVCSDVRNMVTSYSPVTMKTLSPLADESPIGKETIEMNMINPLTKYRMQVQNMEGKQTVGVMATGQKVFFTLNHYFNEGLKRGDSEYLRNLFFSIDFNRIAGRYNGDTHPVTKSCLTNCNLEDVDAGAVVLMSASELLNELKRAYGITDLDIIENTGEWQAHKSEFEQAVLNIKEELRLSPLADLIISELISAATDNAKELILSKINCNSTFAKMYLYLVMVGFDIKDITKFMTSPAVTLVSKRTFGNMLDYYDGGKIHIKLALKEANGYVNISNFLNGSVSSVDEETGLRIFTKSTTIFKRSLGYINNHQATQLRIAQMLLTPEERQHIKDNLNAMKNPKTSTSERLRIYINMRVNGIPLEPLRVYSNLFGDARYKQLVDVLSNYVEGLITQLQEARRQYADSAEYDLDIAELGKIDELSNEISLLGQTFLKLNLGLPSSKEDLMKELSNITRAIKQREDVFEFNIYDFSKVPDSTKNNVHPLDDLCKILLDRNSTLSLDYIKHVLTNAWAYNIINNFDIEAWLEDAPLNTVMDGHQQMFGEDIMNEVESTSYRQLVKEYYNIIKGTFNVFDVIEKVPLYASIFKLLSTEYFIDNYSSSKSYLYKTAVDRIQEEYPYISDNQYKEISKYINDILISSFFNNYTDTHGALTFSVPAGVEYLDTLYRTIVASKEQSINLADPSGRASFKKVFELAMLLLRDTGEFGDIKVPSFRSNLFLQDLLVSYDNRTGQSFLNVSQDLMQDLRTPYILKTIQQYIDGITLLASIDVNGHSLADWIMLYNLFVNLNLYGSDRLTSLFRNMVDNNSVLTEYFKWIADLDFGKIDEESLEQIGFKLNDVYIRIAPYVSSTDLKSGKNYGPFVRTTTAQGDQEIRERIIEDTELGNSPFTPVRYEPLSTALVRFSPSLKANYELHLTIPLIYYDDSASFVSSIMSLDINEVATILKEFSFRSSLSINIKC